MYLYFFRYLEGFLGGWISPSQHLYLNGTGQQNTKAQCTSRHCSISSNNSDIIRRSMMLILPNDTASCQWT